jgi:hypothetical protein
MIKYFGTDIGHLVFDITDSDGNYHHKSLGRKSDLNNNYLSNLELS